MDPTNLAVVAVRPAPRVVHGLLAQSDFAPVAEWITLNEATLIDYWNGTLGTASSLPGCGGSGLYPGNNADQASP